MRLYLDRKEVRVVLLLCVSALEDTTINNKSRCGHMLLVDLREKLKAVLQSKDRK